MIYIQIKLYTIYLLNFENFLFAEKQGKKKAAINIKIQQLQEELASNEEELTDDEEEASEDSDEEGIIKLFILSHIVQIMFARIP